eukprot:TRINITY_DN10089_c0_g1_i1.p1 TRINITY_DN10089_c0_g1~~TRINITY_DN10089_c0_g1_i1.p1  ORF type:complete len:229 (+),score=13.90 TRINITY_DN10089_c0_g1_i1:115-801(+)
MAWLPDEIWNIILYQIDNAFDLARFGQVSRLFRKLSTEDALWKRFSKDLDRLPGERLKQTFERHNLRFLHGKWHGVDGETTRFDFAHHAVVPRAVGTVWNIRPYFCECSVIQEGSGFAVRFRVADSFSRVIAMLPCPRCRDALCRCTSGARAQYPLLAYTSVLGGSMAASVIGRDPAMAEVGKWWLAQWQAQFPTRSALDAGEMLALSLYLEDYIQKRPKSSKSCQLL